MTKIFLLKHSWVWLSTGRGAQQVPRGEMPVWKLSCPSSRMEGKGAKLFKEEPTVVHPHRVCFHQLGKFFPALPKFLQKKPQERWRGWKTLRLSPQCSQNVWEEHGIVLLQTYRKEAMRNQQLVSVIFHPITCYPQAPLNVLQHHRQCCDNETPRQGGFSCILQKQHKTPSSVSVSRCMKMSHDSSVLKVKLTKFKHGNLLLDVKNSILKPDSVVWFKFSTAGHLLKQLVSLLNCPS